MRTAKHPAKPSSLIAPLSQGVFICFLAALFYCYEYLLRIIPGVITNELRVAFGDISATALGTLSAYYYFAYTPMQIPVGILVDKFGPRKLLSLACLLCALGSYLFTFTDHFNISALGRFLIGFGSAFAFVGVLSLANFWLPKRYFSMVAGVVTALGMIGAIAGEVGITLIVKQYGWMCVLLAAVYIGLFLTLLMFLFLHDHPKQKASRAPSASNFYSDVVKVLLSCQVWLCSLIGAFLFMSLAVFAEMWGKSYLQSAHHLNELDAAKSISLVFLGWAVGGPLHGWLSDYYKKHVAGLFISSLLAAGSISAILFIPTLSYLELNWLLFFYGFFCSVEVTVFILAKDNCKTNLTGTVFAVVNMIVMLSGVIFQPLVGRLLDHVWSGQIFNHVRIYSKQDYQLVLSFLPLLLVLTAIMTFFVNEPGREYND